MKRGSPRRAVLAGAGSCRRATTCRRGRSAPGSLAGLHTASAASSVQPPTKTASRRNSACSASVEQVVAPGDRVAQRLLARRQVARAAGEQRQPALEPGQQRPAGESSVIRAAASSIASGSPSRRRQISATAGGVRRRSGRSRAGPPRPARRRARTAGVRDQLVERRAAAPGRAAPAAAPRYSCSPRSAQRRAAGHQHLQPRAGRQQIGRRARRRRRAAARSCRGPAASAPMDARTWASSAVVDRAASPRQPERLGERRRDAAGRPAAPRLDERRRRRGNRRPASAATCSASRVLPTPPGPASVSTRLPAGAQRAEDRGHFGLAPDQRRARDRQRRAGRGARPLPRWPRPVRFGHGRR